ncbi:hypothetical protein SCLCIDRAFT_1214511 [Scleroderma citrinum Foug A]|uniref:Secreted protein n=1 Tax=Scleroderma citrinum Foug A TaxID=1036808 RepID=A0A0C3ADG4_9AGAM|nr:hypothetical protein SCLCIDRAFT_1214511 [Scleroderma citrinum Foug A]
MTAMLLALLFFPIVVSCTDLLKPATRSLGQTIIDLIHLCETLTTLLLSLEMDILFAKNDTRHLFERILLLTFINVVSRMVPSGQLLSVKMLPESSQAQLQSISDARCEEMDPVPLPPVSINLELSSYLQIQDSEASDDEVSDDESCMANDEYMSDADSIEGSLCPSPSDVTIRPTTFYTTLDSEALPLSEIDVAITDDDTATSALKGRKFRRSLRRVWRLRKTTVADPVASRLSVAATISGGSNSSTETLMSTSIQAESRSGSRGSAHDASIACASSRVLSGICLTGGRKQKTGGTLREDRTFGCPPKKRTIAATTRTWLNRCRR